MLKKIAIIKLGALGDVIRTLSILPAIKEKHPESEVTWVTRPQSKGILETHPQISNVLTIPVNLEESFDELYNFDIEKEATDLAKKATASKKYGFYSEDNFPMAFNMPAEYYLNTLFDDELKKQNKKTYQEMMFEVAELPYKKQHSTIHLTKEDKDYANDFVEKNKINTENLIGIHIGASPRWPSKAWAQEKIIDFIKKLKEKNYNVIIFAGPDDKEKQEEINTKLNEKSINTFKNDLTNTIGQFASLIEKCKVIICADSLALHISLALKKPTIALFFCTSHNEVEGYDILRKVISPRLEEFFPEKMDQYDEELINSISIEEVLEELEKIENEKSS